MMRSGLQALVVLILVCSHTAVSTLAKLQPSRQSFLQTKAPGTLLWAVALSDDQCPHGAPCYNIYAVNQTQGELNCEWMLPGCFVSSVLLELLLIGAVMLLLM